MKIVIRTFRQSGRIEWYVVNEYGFVLGMGHSENRRQAFVRGRHAADQYQAERQEWLNELKLS